MSNSKPSTPKKKSDGLKTDAIAYLNRKKWAKGYELRNMFPRRKGVYTNTKNETKEVKEILYPFITNWITKRLTFRKMPRLASNDPRDALILYFNKSTYSIAGVEMVKIIMEETNGQFTKNEIINVLINVIYRHRIDYLSFRFKHQPMKKTKLENNVFSLWNKISEKSHV